MEPASPSPVAILQDHSDCFAAANYRLSWPMSNMGPSLTNTLATVAGNLFELAEVSALRLVDITFREFAESLSRAGLRRRWHAQIGGCHRWSSDRHDHQAERRPVCGGDGALALPARTGWHRLHQGRRIAGQRAALSLRRARQAVMAVLNDHADRAGKKVMYAFNITGEIDEMKRNADLVRDAWRHLSDAEHAFGRACRHGAIRRHAELPLHGHRNGWGTVAASPHIGVSFRAWQKFWRLAGADHLHVNGIANKFSSPMARSSTLHALSASDCSGPIFRHSPRCPYSPPGKRPFRSRAPTKRSVEATSSFARVAGSWAIPAGSQAASRACARQARPRRWG